jgi:hypothetical protein
LANCDEALGRTVNIGSGREISVGDLAGMIIRLMDADIEIETDGERTRPKESEVKRLMKTPKLYFLDTGLCTYLTEWSTPETLESGAMQAILETWIISELLKGYLHNGLTPPFIGIRIKRKLTF